MKCLRDFPFADDAAITAHSTEDLQQLMNRFRKAFQDFGLTISLKKTRLWLRISWTHFTTLHAILKHELEVVNDFVCLILGKAATTISKLTKRVWSNKKLTENTKIQVYRACVLSTLLYGGESWILHARRERKLNTFHMRCLRRILSITWKDRVPNNSVLERTETPSMYTLLKQRRLRWLGHVVRMDDSPFPKNLLYGELANGKRPTGRPQLRCL